MEKFDNKSSLAELNIITMTQCQAQLKAILRKVTDSAPGCLVIHCSGGKDRTGLLVALLLSVVGVSSEEIIADYVLSALYLTPRIAQWREQALATGANMATFDRDTGALPETISQTLAFLEENYGGTVAYCQYIGLSGDEIERLKQRLQN